MDSWCRTTSMSFMASGKECDPMSDRVIDLSEFQPKNIDWQKIKKTGYKVIPRIGLRGSIKGTARYRKICFDLNYKTYISEIIKAGIPFSAYFFPTPMSDAEADQEAEWIISQLDGLVPDMPVYLDSERVPGGMANDITTAQRTRYLKRITDKLVAAGIPCGIYASTSWLQHQINMEDLQEQVQDNTWVAQYATKCTYDGKYCMWQYTSKGNVDGIKGNVDISVITGKFNMSCRKTKETKPVTKEEPEVMTFPVTDPVQISNSGSDEHGNYKNGRAGDNTGREWYIRDWYNRPWNCILRHPDPEVRACIADLAIKAAKSNMVGYDQYQRNTYWNELQKVGYDPSKITTPCEADCSAGVIANIKAAGHLLGRKELQNITCTYTGNMRSALKAAGFKCLTASKYLTGSSYLVAGDILLNDVHHTATAVTNGKNSGQSATQSTLQPVHEETSRTDSEMAVEVILGVHGNGVARQKALGSRYAAVQKLVNQYLKNRSAMITAMAQYAIKGYAGNGDVRKRFFGSYYSEVQKKINQLLK